MTDKEAKMFDAYKDELAKTKKTNVKLVRFIQEKGLGDEYFAWFVANRMTSGEE